MGVTSDFEHLHRFDPPGGPVIRLFTDLNANPVCGSIFSRTTCVADSGKTPRWTSSPTKSSTQF
jgi:hypothetical protein